MKTKTEGKLPSCYAPIDQLGLKIALGMEKFPSNRMIMCYGNPGSGKSTLLYLLTGQYVKNGDEVWIADQERAIDEIYFASYLPNLDGSPEAEQLNAFQYVLKTSEALLKKENKAKEGEREANEEQLALLEERIRILKEIIPALKKGETPNVDRRTLRSITLRCRADYRLRHIKFFQYEHLEEFEKDVIKRYEERAEDPERRHKRLLIGVDSINYLMPAEVLERVTSSEGSNLTAAKYLHTLLPKLITKLSGTETCIMFIHQKTTTIKMNFWQQSSPIDDVAAKGGSAAKFGATMMVGVERRKKAKGADEKEYDTGIIDIPKMKLRNGSKGTFRGTFYLKESHEQSVMDFNEPYILHCLDEQLHGLKRHRGKSYVPARLLEGIPDFQEIVAPRLGPLPKDESENPELYFHSTDAELIALLSRSPAFEEECMLAHDIMKEI